MGYLFAWFCFCTSFSKHFTWCYVLRCKMQYQIVCTSRVRISVGTKNSIYTSVVQFFWLSTATSRAIGWQQNLFSNKKKLTALLMTTPKECYLRWCHFCVCTLYSPRWAQPFLLSYDFIRFPIDVWHRCERMSEEY